MGQPLVTRGGLRHPKSGSYSLAFVGWEISCARTSSQELKHSFSVPDSRNPAETSRMQSITYQPIRNCYFSCIHRSSASRRVMHAQFLEFGDCASKAKTFIFRQQKGTYSHMAFGLWRHQQRTFLDQKPVLFDSRATSGRALRPYLIGTTLAREHHRPGRPRNGH